MAGCCCSRLRIPAIIKQVSGRFLAGYSFLNCELDIIKTDQFGLKCHFNLISNNNVASYLSPLRGLVAAGIIEPHHPGLTGAEGVNFEIRIAALQTHTLAGSGKINYD